MNRIIHFEIPVSDPEKSIAFYESLFGWKFKRFGDVDYWEVTTGPNDEPGINGGLMKRHDPKQPVANTIQVPDVDEALKKIVDAGGKIALPKMAIPGIGWLAYFMDPDGNIHGIMHDDKTAK
jgi:predicted enzyme related to lactoylglutathione lyase